MSLSKNDWKKIAIVLRAGERKTWGAQDPSTQNLGIVLREMAEACDKIAEV